MKTNKTFPFSGLRRVQHCVQRQIYFQREVYFNVEFVFSGLRSVQRSTVFKVKHAFNVKFTFTGLKSVQHTVQYTSPSVVLESPVNRSHLACI